MGIKERISHRKFEKLTKINYSFLSRKRTGYQADKIKSSFQKDFRLTLQPSALAILKAITTHS